MPLAVMMGLPASLESVTGIGLSAGARYLDSQNVDSRICRKRCLEDTDEVDDNEVETAPLPKLHIKKGKALPVIGRACFFTWHMASLSRSQHDVFHQQSQRGLDPNQQGQFASENGAMQQGDPPPQGIAPQQGQQGGSPAPSRNKVV
jgi:hypothetical protein